MRILILIGLIMFFCIPSSVNARKPPALNIINGSSFDFVMPDIALRDTSGQLIKLSSIRGKIIYYDFWAAWCPLCLKEMKYLKELQEKMKDKDVQWVNISFDKDIQIWKKSVRENNLKGYQLYAGKEGIKTFKEELSIYGIPFIIWADSTNAIIKFNAPRPSNSDVSEKLNRELDKINAKNGLTRSVIH